MLLSRKVWKKVGHDGLVKLLPRLVSKGIGSDADVAGAAVSMVEDPVVEEVADSVLVAAAVLDNRLEVDSARRPSRARGLGAARVSMRSSPMPSERAMWYFEPCMLAAVAP